MTDRSPNRPGRRAATKRTSSPPPCAPPASRSSPPTLRAGSPSARGAPLPIWAWKPVPSSAGPSPTSPSPISPPPSPPPCKASTPYAPTPSRASRSSAAAAPSSTPIPASAAPPSSLSTSLTAAMLPFRPTTPTRGLSSRPSAYPRGPTQRYRCAAAPVRARLACSHLGFHPAHRPPARHRRRSAAPHDGSRRSGHTAHRPRQRTQRSEPQERLPRHRRIPALLRPGRYCRSRPGARPTGRRNRRTRRGVWPALSRAGGPPPHRRPGSPARPPCG